MIAINREKRKIVGLFPFPSRVTMRMSPSVSSRRILEQRREHRKLDERILFFGVQIILPVGESVYHEMRCRRINVARSIGVPLGKELY